MSKKSELKAALLLLISAFTIKYCNSKTECMVCYYWLFNNGFKFQEYVCNDRQYLMMLYLNIIHINIIVVKGVDYHCIIYDISKF